MQLDVYMESTSRTCDLLTLKRTLWAHLVQSGAVPLGRSPIRSTASITASTPQIVQRSKRKEGPSFFLDLLLRSPKHTNKKQNSLIGYLCKANDIKKHIHLKQSKVFVLRQQKRNISSLLSFAIAHRLA